MITHTMNMSKFTMNAGMEHGRALHPKQVRHVITILGIVDKKTSFHFLTPERGSPNYPDWFSTAFPKVINSMIFVGVIITIFQVLLGIIEIQDQNFLQKNLLNYEEERNS